MLFLSGLSFGRIGFNVENIVALVSLFEHLLVGDFIIPHLEHHSYFLPFAINRVPSEEGVLVFAFYGLVADLVHQV